MTENATRATDLLRLHQAPELLTVVNVWDVISARVVTDIEGTTALATASHSIAASRGYEDGENIPVDEMIYEVGRIAAATHLPVTADLEGGLRRRRRDHPQGDRGRHRRRQPRGPDEAAGRGSRAGGGGGEGAPRRRASPTSCSTPAPTPSCGCSAPTATPTRCSRTPSHAARRSSTRALRWCSCRASSPSSRSRRWSRRSGRSGSPPSASPATRTTPGSPSTAWPGSPTARSRSGWRSPRWRSSSRAIHAGGGVPEDTRPLN